MPFTHSSASILRGRAVQVRFSAVNARIRFSSSLALLEQKDGRLQEASFSAITAAGKVGGTVTALIAGGNVKAAATEASKIKGLDKVLMVENAAYEKVSLLA